MGEILGTKSNTNLKHRSEKEVESESEHGCEGGGGPNVAAAEAGPGGQGLLSGSNNNEHHHHGNEEFDSHGLHL
ncbi:hypothetical protein V2J09_022758 [Rumex salicifolius]